MSCFAKLKVQLTKAADFPGEAEQDCEIFYLDLSGLFAHNSHMQCEIHAFSAKELVQLFEKLRPHLTTIFIGADKGMQAAEARAPQLALWEWLIWLNVL